MCAALCAASIGDEARAVPQEFTIYTEWRGFTQDDGLPPGAVRCIALDGKRVWAGTDGGLACFEDAIWNDRTRQWQLPKYPVRAIRVDPDTGDLWVGTLGGGLVRVSGGRSFVFDQVNSGLAGDIVFDVQIWNGDIWAATSGGLSRYQPNADSWDLYNPRTAVTMHRPITTLAPTPERMLALEWRGQIWSVAPGEGTEKVAALIKQPYIPLDSGALALAAPGVAVTSSTVVIGSAAEQVVRPLPFDARSEFVLTCGATGDGTAWVGTTDGLHQVVSTPPRVSAFYRATQAGVEVALQGTGSRRLLLKGTLPQGVVRAIALDEQGIWVGTDRGVARGTAPKPLPGAISDQPQEPPSSAPSDPAAQPSDPAARKPVTIAIYGPRSRTITLPDAATGAALESPRPDMAAVEMMVAQANRRDRSGLDPIEVIWAVRGYSRYGWGLPEDDIAQMARHPQVVGIIGAVPAADRVTDAVALQTDLPWMNTAPEPEGAGADDPKNPMIFRCWGDVPRQHRILFDHVLEAKSGGRCAFLAANDDGAIRHIRWWLDCAGSRPASVVFDARLPDEPGGVPAALDPMRAAQPDFVFLWANSEITAAVLRASSRWITATTIVTGPAVLQLDQFTGLDLSRVVALVPALPIEPCTDVPGDFAAAYRAELETRATGGPRAEALRSAHATDHLLYALNQAGHDRYAIHRVLKSLERSCNGEAHFEQQHPDASALIAEYRDGRWQTRRLLPPGGTAASP